MRPIRPLLLACAAAASLLAAAPQARAAAAPAQAAEDSADARVMQAENLVLPVVVDGRLVNYLFVDVRVELAPRGNLWRLKERAHFLRHALLRAAHRSSLAAAGASATLDAPAAERAFHAAAEEALGAGAVRGVSVTQTGALRRTR